MQLVNNKIRLSELAKSLGVTSSALRQHVSNPKSHLGENAEKFGSRTTGDFLLDVDSVYSFLEWLVTKGRKVRYEDIQRVRDEIKLVN